MPTKYRLPNGRLIEAGTPFELGGGADLVRFPANWLQLATPADLARHGIAAEETPDPPPPAPATAAERVARTLDGNPVLDAFVGAVARKVGMTRQELIDAAIAEVKP